MISMITCIILVALITTVVLGQPANLEFGSESGSRAFVLRSIDVPLRFGKSAGRTRSLPAGCVIKLWTAKENDLVVGYDDVGMFKIDREDFVVLTGDLDSLLQKFEGDNKFQLAFAKGSYYLNTNLNRARGHFQNALRTQPENAHAQLGLALAQSDTVDKRRLLDAVGATPEYVKLLARTHRAKLDQNYADLKEIGENEFAPALVYQEMLAFLLLNDRQRVTPERLQPLITSATEFGSSPRLLNLNAMMLRSDALDNLLTQQQRAEGVITACKMAIELDPYFYHAHMTLGEMLYSAGYHSEAGQEFEKALRLHPTLIPALTGYLKAVEAMQESGQAIPESWIAHEFDLRQAKKDLVSTRDSDLPENSQRSSELFIHGFLPVNHGGAQPKKLELLKQKRASEAIRYLRTQLSL